MALSAEDRQQIREIIQDCTTGVHARTEAQFTVIDNKLDGINTHLKNLNGSVLKHSKEIEEIKSLRDKKYQELDDYIITMKEVPIRVRKLEDQNLSNASIKKFMAAMFISGTALGGLIISALDYILK